MASQETQRSSAPARTADNPQQMMLSPRPGTCPPFAGYPPCFMMPFPPQPGISGGPTAPWPYPPVPMPSWGALSHPHVTAGQADPTPDHYTVDSMRRIYSNEDASIEIERVKVQRRQQQFVPPQSFPYPYFPPNLNANFQPNFPSNFPMNFANMGADPKGLVPAIGPSAAPIRRPPPRKNRKNKLNNQLVPSQAINSGSYPPGYPYPTPYFSYVPYPYPYPYFSYPALQNASVPAESLPSNNNANPGNSQNDTTQRIRPLESSNSQQIDSGPSRSIRDSISPDAGRPLSPNAPSQISLTTESLGTDINPSDSVSVGGYRKSGRTSQHEGEKDNHWIIEMQRHLASIDALSEDGDRSSFATAQSDVPTPPIRRRRQKYDSKQASIDSTSEHIRQPLDIDKQATADSISEPIRPSISQNESVSTKSVQKEIMTPSDVIKKADADTEQLRQARQTQKQTTEDGVLRDTTQQEQPFPISTNDLSIKTKTVVDCVKASERTDVKFEAVVEEKMATVSLPTAWRNDEAEVAADDHSWVLLTKDEAPDVASVWLADVSVWRARLVVSLDKGQGLDQQDWATFHLLTQHPLPVTLKLSMLHAPRLCAANANVGAVQVRAALLQLARHAQVLLQQEDERPPDWKSISASLSQPWAPVKGGKEILRLLGFRHRDDGSLRYSRRLSPEASHVARLTLDMLLLADELRLYLTGGHPHPSNISDLFCPVTAVSPPPNRFTLRADGEPMQVYHSSADFISAETTPVFDRKVEQDKQLQDLNDLNVNDSPVKVSYNEQLLHRTSSEEDITLHENGASEKRSTQIMKASVQDENIVKTIQRPPSVLSQGGTSTVVSDNLSASTDIASLPELQSAASPVPSNINNYKTVRESPKRESIRRSPETSSTHSKSIANAVDLISTRREDHIYEEIGEIRSQVQKLRSSVSVPNLPPPLPPKCHSMDEDNSSTYSRSDWSAASSIGGSTGRRRRKRRAPLPPSFMRLSIKENLSPQGSHTDQLSRADKQSSTSGRNPFYDEIGENKPKLPVLEEHKDQESKGSNPFHDTRFEPSGYVGANPFYEDVKKVKMNSIKEDATTSLPEPEKDLQSTGTSDRAISKDQLPRQQLGREESVNNEQDELIEHTVRQQTVTPLEERQENIIVPSDIELQDVDLNSTAGDTEMNSFQAPNQRSLETQTKNVEQKQHRGSQDVVSVDLTRAESNDAFMQANELHVKPDNHEVHKLEPSALNPEEKLDNIENLAHAKYSSHGVPNSSHQTHSNAEGYCENSQNSNKLENEINPKKLPAEVVIFDAYKIKVGEATISSASSNGNQPSCTSVISDIPYIDSSDVISYKASRDSSSKIPSEESCLKNLAPQLSNTPPLDSPPPPPLPPPLPSSSSSPPSSSPPLSSLTPLSSIPPSLPPPNNPDLHQPSATLVSPSQKSTDFLASSSSQTKLEIFEPLNSIQPFTSHMDVTKENKPTQKSCIMASAKPVDKNEQLEKFNFEEVDVKSAVVFSSSSEGHLRVRQGPVCCEYYEIPEKPDQPPPLPAKPNSLHLQKAPELPPKLLRPHTVSAKENSESDGKNETSTGSQIPSLTRDNNVSSPNRNECRSQQPVDASDSNLIHLKFSHGEDASKITDGTNTNEVLDATENETLSEHFKNHSPKRSPSKPPRRHRMAPQSSTMPRLPPKTKNSSSPNSHSLQQKYRTLPSVASGSPETKKRGSVRLSLSTPSSPKPSTKPSPAKLSRTSKTRKSWPFLLCDCFYTDHDKHDSNRGRHHFSS